MTARKPRILFASGWYDKGMRDFHLALMKDWRECTPISVVRVTYDLDPAQLAEEHRNHGVDTVHAVTMIGIMRHLSRMLPIFSIYVIFCWMRYRPERIIITNDGYCFWSIPSAFLKRRASVFYHDPKPHESAAQKSLMARFENSYKGWLHRRKRWKSILIGSAEYLPEVQQDAASPVELIAFPRFTKYLFPKSSLPPEAAPEGYVLIYGRIDTYKGIYDWLTEVSPYFDCIPRILLAGKVVDKRVYEFEGPSVQIIDRFIDIDEVWGLFEGARAVVLPYKTVTHSGIGDISISFGKDTYLPELDYFKTRYGRDRNARPLAVFIEEMSHPVNFTKLTSTID